MAFTILHPSDAIEDPANVFPQAQWDRKDIEIITAGFSNVGVISGCAVTAQGTPNMSVHVAAGTVMVGGSTTLDIVNVSAGDVTITAAHATLPRFDLVVASNVGALSAVAGTAAATPVFPTIPASRVVLASVYVPAADTAINTNQIVDKKMPLPTPPAPSSATWTTVSKPSDQVKVSDTTLAVDSVLKVTMTANTKYRMRGRVHVGTESGTPDFKYRFVGPAAPTLVLIRHGYANPTSGGDTTAMLNAYSAVDHTGLAFTTAFETFLWFDATIHNGANAGDFQFQWAQQTSSADDTIVRAGSFIDYGTA